MPLNSERKDAVLLAMLWKASTSERLRPGPSRGALFTQGEEEEGDVGALLNHYQTATRTTAALIHAIIRPATAIIHSLAVRHATPATVCPNAQSSVNILTHICATTTEEAAGEQLKQNKPVK